jgi:hypothetical protein
LTVSISLERLILRSPAARIPQTSRTGDKNNRRRLDAGVLKEQLSPIW